jgi:signal peptidase I
MKNSSMIRLSKQVNHFTFNGWSMYPVLKPGDTVHIDTTSLDNLRIGDVVVFRNTQNKLIAHRIVYQNDFDFITAGDNNAQYDDEILKPDRIVGKVTLVQSGRATKHIRGGAIGIVKASLRRKQLSLWKWIAYLFGSFYKKLAKNSPISMKSFVRPHLNVIRFSYLGKHEHQLMFFKHRIGRFSQDSGSWQIRPPFRFFVDTDQIRMNK